MSLSEQQLRDLINQLSPENKQKFIDYLEQMLNESEANKTVIRSAKVKA